MKRGSKQRSSTADSSKKRGSSSTGKGGKKTTTRGKSNQKGGGKQSYKAALKGHGAKQNAELQKVNQQQHYKKFLTKHEEYFPQNKGQEDEEGFMFNKAPVIKKNEKIEQSKTQKDIQQKKKKQMIKEKKMKQSKLVELDSDEDPISYSVGKKQMYESDVFGDEEGNEVQETFFKSMKYDFTSYFMLNKSEMDQITKVPKMKIKEGAYVLGAIYDKGPSERYLEINLGRSTKGYITNTETCENDFQHNLKEYSIGEYVQAIVVPSINPEKLQLSLQPSRLNHTLNFEDIFVGMVLQGTVASEEDFGYKINFFTKDRCIGFLKISDDSPIELSESKCYMFSVQSKDSNKKILQVSLLDKDQSPKVELDGEDMLGLDLSNLVKPGNLVNCIVSKVLENGVIVKFSKVFFGYIFQDYLQEPLESYKSKQKFRARIIMADIPNKQINLSTKQEHLDMKELRENENNFFKVGQIFDNGYTVKKSLYGGSYLVTLKNAGGQEIDAYIHVNHVNKEDQDKLKEGIHIKRQVQIKEMNYFEHYPVITSMQQKLKKNDIQWGDIAVGETYKGTIAQITESNEQYRILVTLSESVKGILEHIHLNDVPSKYLPKNIKEGRKVNVRVLSFNRQEKRLKFTMKPTLMLQEEEEQTGTNSDIIKNFEDIKIGQAYNGFITKAMEYGFFVQFFNNISGLLSFKDLEEVNKINRKTFKVGQTVQVYVQYVNLEEKKIGLSYSQKGVNNYQISNQNHKQINKILQTVKPLSQAEPSFASGLSNVNIGETFDYIVDKKQSESQSNYLVLKYKTKDSGDKSHKAIVLLQHLSDYAEHYESMFNLYKNSLSNPKVKGIVIGKLDDDKGYALVSLKPCLLENDKKFQSVSDLKKGDQIFGYADYQTSSGTIVKINDNFKGFAQINQKQKNENGEEQENTETQVINMGDSLLLNVRKIDGEKLYFTVSKKVQVVNSQLKYKPFIGYLKEEFQINRKHINQQVKRWLKFKTGNFVEAKVSLIKEYGVILNIVQEAGATNITGFITNDNLQFYKKKDLKTDQVIICQILDVDYEKDILDLVSVKDDKENKEKVNQLTYNLDLAKKENLNQQLQCKVVLKKEAYSIARAESGLLVLVESKTLNQQNKQEGDEEVLDSEDEENNIENNKQVNLKVINIDTFGKSVNDINAFNKINYLPITQIVPVSKKAKMEVEGEENKEKTGEKQQQKKEKSDEKSLEKALKGIKAKLQLGGIVTGTVKNVKPTNITVELVEGVVAKLHKTQINENDKKVYKQGDEIKAKIVNIKKDVHLQIDLTTLSEHMNLPEGKLMERILIPDNEVEFLDKFSIKPIKGCIKSVNINSIHPLYVEFSNSHLGNVACFDGLVDFSKKDLNLASEVEKVKNLRKTYKPGQIINFYIKECPSIKNIEASLVKPQSSLDVGAIRIAKVCGQNGKKIRVQLDSQVFGEVDIIEVSDDWLANPLLKYKKNDLVPVRVLQENVRGEFDCSMRQSILNVENWEKALSPVTGTTMNFKKMFSEQQNNGDVRSRLYKLGQGSLKTGMLVIGYVNECNKNGCYIKVSFNLSVRAQLNDLSDEHIPNPQAYFYKNKLVIARVVKVKEDGKVDVSLRESVILYGYSLDITKLKTGLTVEGIVTEHKKGKAVLQLQKCKYKAKLSKKDYDIPEDKQTAYFEVILPKGSVVKAQIKSLKLEPYVKIALSTIMKSENEEESKIEEEEKEEIKQLIQSIKEIAAQNVEQEKKSQDIQISLMQQQPEIEEQDLEEEEEDSDDELEQQELLKQYAYQDNAEQESGDSQSEEEFDEEIEEDEDEEEEVDSEDIKSEQSAMEEEDEEEISNKKKSRRQKELIKRRKEEKIREKEQKLLNEDALPENEDDFEKMILKNPNSSFVWIKYMAFSMGQKGIEGARQTAERALKVINFRNETEKLNVWTAFMNLEHNFGTEKQLINIFQRATSQCKPKLVYFRLLDIYKKSEKYDLLFELAKTMIKKFKHSSKVWLEYMKTISDIKSKQQDSNNNQFDLKEILKRSLQCLKKKKHIIILSHYSRLMFIHNEPEKGRTTFDAILSNYPKRTDIWSVFLDMETKYGTQQSARNLFERCISMEFKPRQMKFFFKRYLQYELQHGQTEKAEAVKEKAQEYVKSLIASGQVEDPEEFGNQDEEEDNNEQQEENGDNDDDEMQEE